ncbi:MAG: cobalamin biosynthesis protein [Pseudomonadales bacterium]|nr:cobalamin biosynthesis protein [Pseudomonadales bacterium]
MAESLTLLSWPWSVAFTIIGAFALDRVFGELPNHLHPLRAFGHWAGAIEKRLNHSPATSSKFTGLLALLLTLVLPLLVLFLLLNAIDNSLAAFLAGICLLYFSIGRQSLRQHALAIRDPLEAAQLALAREATAMIVSRDTATLDEEAIATACVESVLENGSDAVFAPVFWFVIGGPLAAIAYRLVNTLDAMWGYRNPRFEQFGWAAARLDDLLNLLPARCCALCYALAGNTGNALHCWQQQGANWKSPNAGPVMAAGAGALGIRLGGRACYDNIISDRPLLGQGRAPFSIDIQRSLQLLDRALLVGFFLLLAVLSVLYYLQ